MTKKPKIKNYKKEKKVVLSSLKKKEVSFKEPNTNKEKIIFSFQYMDVSNNKWSLQRITEEESYAVIEKLFHFQNTTWGNIRGNHEDNHFIDIKDINKDAFKIINEKYADLFNEKIFSFRITGKKRLFGIVNGKVFYIIWYDKNHEICPSHKRHT